MNIFANLDCTASIEVVTEIQSVGTATLYQLQLKSQ